MSKHHTASLLKISLVFLLVLVSGYFFSANTAGADSSGSSNQSPVLSDNVLLSPSAHLDTGIQLNAKMKSLAAGNTVTADDPDNLIKAIRMTDFLPEGFSPTEANTISAESSVFPIYIFFENTDDAGIMYVYTEGDHIIAASSFRDAFFRMSGLNDISGLAEWDMSHVVDMSRAFHGTLSLSDISALSGWDTGNVVSFFSTFCNSGITDASSLADWNTSSAVYMAFMFAYDKSLTKVDVSGWDTHRVTSMMSMFSVGENHKGNGQLNEIIGLENMDVSSVTDMTAMFYGAGNMTHYDISGWNVSNVQSFNHMFCDNFRLESLDLSRWNVSSVKTMFDMFDDNYMLTTIGDVSNWNTASLIDAGGWLNGACSFVGDNGTLDLSGWNTENLKAAGEMFRAAKLQTIDLSGWVFSSVTNTSWEGAGVGIYYETGNTSGYIGLAGMFKDAFVLNTVYLSKSGRDSYEEAVSRGITVSAMWEGTPAQEFTIR